MEASDRRATPHTLIPPISPSNREGIAGRRSRESPDADYRAEYPSVFVFLPASFPWQEQWNAAAPNRGRYGPHIPGCKAVLHRRRYHASLGLAWSRRFRMDEKVATELC